ncbi:GDSL esterase/lipase At5g63170 [Rosa chinensis]|uniref:GDSL esterase/lipase At5g63170 n=1 Tax=Rosa chinensis TaxID=74649 RepID=UPI001AD9257C|nr:GDSL esterase/lipase At5g63170 [Rosa chinensis]
MAAFMLLDEGSGHLGRHSHQREGEGDQQCAASSPETMEARSRSTSKPSSTSPATRRGSTSWPELLGASAVANISKSLFIISVGSNDIFEHYDANDTSTGQNYITTLISTYETHLRNLYELGARRFGIISVGALGCCPILRSKYGGCCLEPMNRDAQLFYTALRDLLQKLSSECKGLMYALGDSYDMSKYILDHPDKSGN